MKLLENGGKLLKVDYKESMAEISERNEVPTIIDELVMHISDEKITENLVSTSDWIMIGLNKAYKVMLWNHQAETCLGYKQSEVLGRNIFELFLNQEYTGEEGALKLREIFSWVGSEFIGHKGKEIFICGDVKPISLAGFSSDFLFLGKDKTEYRALRRYEKCKNIVSGMMLREEAIENIYEVIIHALQYDLKSRVVLILNKNDIIKSYGKSAIADLLLSDPLILLYQECVNSLENNGVMMRFNDPWMYKYNYRMDTLAINHIKSIPLSDGNDALGMLLVWNEHMDSEELSQTVQEYLNILLEIKAEHKKNVRMHLADAVYSSVSESILVCDLDYNIISANPAFFSMTGYNNEILGRSSNVLFKKPSGKKVHFESLHEQGVVWEGELLCYKKDGETFTAGCTIKKSDARQEKIILFVFSNLNKKKEAEFKLKERDLILNSIVENSLDAVISIDESGKILSWNFQAMEIFGWSDVQVKGKDFYDLLFLEKYRELHYFSFKKFKDTKDEDWINSRVEFTAINNVGETFGVELSMTAVHLNNSYQFVCFIRDLRLQDEKEVELKNAINEAQKASQYKSDFLANMSHEIRTPLNSVIGMTHLALLTELTQQQKDYLTKIQFSGKHLLVLLNDILDISKIESGSFEFESIDFSLTKVVKQTTQICQQLAVEKGLDLVFNVEENVPSFIKGDPLRLSQVLLNLLNNAIKFTEKGSVTTKVSVKGKKSNGIVLRFDIIDTGIGIKKENLDKLFSPFHQADSSITRKYGGTGLGLAISSNIISLQDGEMGVSSEEKIGSNFWFELFYLPSDKNDEGIKDEINILKSHKGSKVLLVEDNRFNQQVALEFLEQMDIVTCVANNGKEAIDLLNKEHFDLILMDMHMPVMSGMLATKLIRKNVGWSKIPIIAMTASVSLEEKSLFLKIGINGVVEKPVDPYEFHSVLNKWLDHPTIYDQVLLPEENKYIRLKSLHALVVEDSRFNQQVVCEYLSKVGVTFSIANNGKEALELLETNSCDFILMDLQMPVMGGFEATKVIRSDEKYKEMLIIAVTANTYKEDMVKCLEIGMDDFVAKPIHPDILYDKILKGVVSLDIHPVALMKSASTVHSDLSLKRKERKIFEENTLIDLNLISRTVSKNRDQILYFASCFIETAKHDIDKSLLLVKERNMNNCIVVINSLAEMCRKYGAQEMLNACDEVMSTDLMSIERLFDIITKMNVILFKINRLVNKELKDEKQ